MQQKNTNQSPEFQQTGSNPGLRDVVLKYIIYLPLFVLSMVLSLGVVNIYLRYADRVFQSNSQILVGAGETSSPNVTAGDMLELGLNAKRSINIDNELQLLRSHKLIYKVVRKGNFNVRYFQEGTIRRMELYKNAPFIVNLLSITDSSYFWELKITKLTKSGGEYKLGKNRTANFKWLDTLNLPIGRIVIEKNPEMNFQEESQDPYIVQWNTLPNAVYDIMAHLSVKSFSIKTTIISLSYTSSNAIRGADILDLLGTEFAEQDVELKREISVNTLRFIDERLKIVSSDIKSIDSNKMAQNDVRFLDAESELTYYKGKFGESESRLDEIFIDTSAVRILEDFIKDDRNKYKKIYSHFGVNDVLVRETIAKYNSLMADWEKAAFENPDDNDIMSAIENNIENSRNKILQSLAYYKKTNAIKIKLYNEKNNQYSSRLVEIPKKISTEMELKKQKDLKERLYLYLLQKREETAIASISNKSNYSSIDKAGYSLTPIEPQESRLKTFAMLLGLVIPVAIIYLADLLNDKIISKKEIVSKTGAPIVAEISHYDGQDDMVINKTRSVIAEQFRILRSNLQFLIPATEDNKTKVFLVCSTISGEGKSFISNNLAGVLELTDKKVALLEFDLRKLKSINSIENEKFNRGITNYLVGQEDDLNKLHYSVTGFPKLHVFKTGPLPPNPAELMIGERMDLLFKNLRANYDFIVLDSSPVGLVGDAFALDKFSDATVYIVRQRYSIKKQLDFISELKETGKFKNLVIVVNDINESVRNNYYGYGKAYGNGGYGKYYGDSNPYFDVPAKTWWLKLWKK